MNDLIPSARLKGRFILMNRIIVGYRCCSAQKTGWDGLPEANPFPMSIFDNILMVRITWDQRLWKTEIVESTLKAAAHGMIQDKLHKSAFDFPAGSNAP